MIFKKKKSTKKILREKLSDKMGNKFPSSKENHLFKKIMLLLVHDLISL